MISKWRWIIVQISRKLWVRAVLFAVLAVVTALAAIFLKHYIPYELSAKIGAEAVDKILSILASSMLAVTTFSLSVMVAAYSAATTNISPRATKLLMADPTTQNVLATFVGSFLYSLVGITALSTGIYGAQGRVILFVVTLGVIALIVATVLLWIDHLSHLGRVSETCGRVEKATHNALCQRVEYPWLGGAPFPEVLPVPEGAVPVFAEKIGYVQHIDVTAISHWAEKFEADIYINSLPGAFVHGKRALAWVDKASPEARDALHAIESAYSIATERSFDQDPRFGLSVLTEIAARALSPAINDPGTAIEIIGRGVRILSSWEEPDITRVDQDKKITIDYPRVKVPGITTQELFDDFFTSIARDGAGLIEVQIRLQKALHALAQIDERFRSHAVHHSQAALQRAERAMTFEGDVITLRNVVESLALQPD